MPWKVNGEPIDDAVFREEARTIRPQLQQAMEGEDPALIEARVKEWSRENVIERLLLRKAALADQEPISPDQVEELLARVREQTPGESGCVALGSDEGVRAELEVRLRVDRLLARAAAKVSAPGTKDIAEYYRKHRDDFRTDETVHARHIVKNVGEGVDEAAAREALEQAQAELTSGKPFEILADELSDCPGRGGDLGFFPRGQMVDEFEQVVFSLPPGQTSEIFRSPFGFHIARVEARRPAGHRSLEEVKDEIAQRLLEEKRQKAVDRYLDSLWKNADIQEFPA